MPEASNIDDHLGRGLPVPPEGKDFCLRWLSLLDLVHQVVKKKDLIAETLGGEKSVGEDALGVVICQPPPPF